MAVQVASAKLHGNFNGKSLEQGVSAWLWRAFVI